MICLKYNFILAISVSFFLQLVVVDYFLVRISYATIEPDIVSCHSSTTVTDIKDNTYNISGGKEFSNNKLFAFEKFNLKGTNASATFEDHGISNTIVKIFGNNISHIDGAINSSAANFFFINPAGIFIGQNAEFNVSNSLYISTNDLILNSNTALDKNFLSIDIDETNLTLPSFSFLPDSSSGSITLEDFKYSFNTKNVIFNGNINVENYNSLSNLTIEGNNISINDSYIHTSNTKNISFIGNNINIEHCHILLSNLTIEGNNLNINNSYIQSDNSIRLSSTQGDIIVSGHHDEEYNVIALESNNIHISGKNIKIMTAQIELTNFFGEKGDYSGNAQLYASKNINLLKGASIQSNSGKGKNGGTITLKSDENIIIDGGESIIIDGANFINVVSSICSVNNISGKGGNIELTAKNIFLTNGGHITTTSYGGIGGEITINSDNVVCDGKKTFDNGEIFKSGIFSEFITSKEQDDGKAGVIQLKTSKLSLLNDAVISTSAENMATAGKVDIFAKNSIIMKNSSIKSNVKDGSGGGGNIVLTTELLAMINSNASVTADEGDGGSIFIISEHFFKDTRSTLEVFSNTGKEGNLVLDLLNPDTENIFNLPKENPFIDSTKWIKKKCPHQYSETVSQYVISSRDGLPTPYDDWLYSGPVLFNRNNKKIKKIITDYDSGQLYSAYEQINLFLSSSDDDENLRFDLLQLKVHICKLFGHYEKALTILNQCRSDFIESDIHKSLIYNSLSDLSLLSGQKKQAQKNFFYAREYISDINPDVQIILNASILNNKANIYAAKELYKIALKYNKQSYKKLTKGNFKKYGSIINSLKAKLLINQLRCKWQIQRLKEKQSSIVRKYKAKPDIKKIQQVSHFLTGQNVSFDQLWHMNAFGVLLLSIYDHSESYTKKYLYELIQEAFNYVKENSAKIQNQKLESCAYGYLSTLYLKNKLYSQAIEMNRQAIQLSQNGYYPEISFQWFWQAGKIFHKQNQLTLSEKEYFKALTILDPVFSVLLKQGDISQKQDIFCPSEIIWEFYRGYRKQKNTFNDLIMPFYSDYMEVLHDISVSKNSEQLNIMRMLIERLNTINIQDFYQDECFENTIDNSIPDFSKNVAVLYPFSLHNKCMMLLLKDNTIKCINLPVDIKKIKSHIKNLHHTLRISPASEDDKPVFNDKFACILYDALITPLKNDLSDIDTLMIIPDQLFRTIPFSALKNRSLNNYLIEEYALCTLPSISLARSNFSSVNLENVRIFFGGLSETNSREDDNLSGVIEELNSISKVFANIDSLVGKNFTHKNLLLKTKKNKYNIWHFSTHYIFDSSINNTYMKLYDKKITVREFESLFRLKRYQQEPADLLFLNACETAKGSDKAFLGLGGIALRTGVKCAIATLWPVNDKEASLMAKEFYSKIDSSHGITNIRALQYAKQNFIKMDRYNHPYYWAPYTMIGF